MSAPTLILTPKKVLVPYDAERYALKSSQVEQGDLCYVADTGKWWLVVDVANLSNDNGYDNIHTDSVAESFTHVDITGTAGNGYITLPSQSSAPAAPSDGNIRIYSDSDNKFAWIGASGFTRNFDGTLTASRTYALPDFSGTVALIGASSQAGTLSVGTVLVGGGTAGAPSIAFTGQPSTGFYQATTGEIDVAVAGVKTLQFYPSGQIFGAQGNNYLLLNSSGAVALFASGTNQSIILTPSGSGAITSAAVGGIQLNASSFTGGHAYTATAPSGQSVALRLLQSSVTDWDIKNTATTGMLSFVESSSTKISIASTGHLLLGGLTTDGTGVLQFPLGAADFTSGLGFAADTWLFRQTGNDVTLSRTSKKSLFFYSDANNAGIFTQVGAGASGIYSNSTQWVFTTGEAVTALTLDSSQNATFAGNVSLSAAGGQFIAGSAGHVAWSGRSDMKSPADGQIAMTNSAATDFSRLQLGGTTSSFPSIKRNGTALNFRLADDSADCAVTAAGATLSASSSVAGNLTLTGTALITKVGGTIPLITTSTAITSGAGASTGTLLNAPASGNPTAWVPINDNGTTRYIPAW